VVCCGHTGPGRPGVNGDIKSGGYWVVKGRGFEGVYGQWRAARDRVRERERRVGGAI